MKGFYVQFTGESLEDAIAAHEEPFETIEKCMQETGENEGVGTIFNVVDATGKIHSTCIVNSESVDEIDPDELEG